MTRRQGHLKLGAFLYFTGHHVAAWRHPEASTGDEFRHFADFARAAEAAKFDAVFLADSVGVRLRNLEAASHKAHTGVSVFEPLTLLSALSVVTERIGLVATASTSFTEPYNLARQFASLRNSSTSSRVCGIRGRTTPSRATGRAVAISIQKNCMCSITTASISACAVH
jgi:hypothetical protein